MTQISKLPWEMEQFSNELYLIKDDLGNSIMTNEGYEQIALDMNDAQLIIKAVNNHHALVDMVKTLILLAEIKVSGDLISRKEKIKKAQTLLNSIEGA